MKYILLITLAICSNSYSMDETTKEKVNCDDLARHILQSLPSYRAFRTSDNSLRFIGSLIYWERKIPNCSYSDELNSNSPESSQMETLSDSTRILGKYREALKRCLRDSATPSTLATQTIDKLQQQITLNSQCADEYDQSLTQVRRRQATMRAERKRMANLKPVMENYINAKD